MALGRQLGVDLEAVLVLGHQRLDGGLGDRAHPLVEQAEVLVDDRRAQPPEHRLGVVADVAHPVHRVAEQRQLGPPQRAHRLGRPAQSANARWKRSERQSPVMTENGMSARTSALAWSWAPWMPWL